MGKAGLWSFYFPSIFKKELADSDRWRITASVCEKIADEFQRYDTSVFFVLVPSHYQVDEGTFERYLEITEIDPSTVHIKQPNELLAKEFEIRGLNVVDPVDHLREKAKNGEVMYGKVNKHFINAGHRVLADYLYPKVISHLFARENRTGKNQGVHQDF
jgi:hypothetical protein